MAWTRVASIEDVQPGKPYPVKTGGKELAIYRIDDAIHVLEDICPHAYALLSDGFIEGDAVECPLHQATFHIPTGKCLAPPADRDLETYAVKIEGRDILIDI